MAELDDDAFGRACQWFAEYGTGRLVIERSDGHVNTESISGYFSDYEHWPAHQKAACALANGVVLDVGCGPGRHALYLQSIGLDVAGVDGSPHVVDLAKRRGLRRVICASIEELRPGTEVCAVDTFLFLGMNGGLFASANSAKKILDSMSALANTNARAYIENASYDPQGEAASVQYVADNRRRGHLPGRMRMRYRFGRAATSWFDWTYMSPEEFVALLAGSGWAFEGVVERTGGSYACCIRYMK